MKIAIAFVLVSSLIGFAVCQTSGDVRLNGSLPGKGVVDIYLNGEWGTVRPLFGDYFGAGNAVCRQLGYRSANAADSYDNMKNSCGCQEASGIPSLLNQVYCVSNYYSVDGPTHILQCSYSSNRVSNPDHSQDLVVSCSSSLIDDFPYDSQVRLVQSGTGYKSSGFVEVYLNNRWGPVCNMTSYAADTTCTQLGYSRAASYSDRSGYSGGRTDQLTSFTCYSSYTCLRNCFSYPPSFGYSSCSLHSVVNCTFDPNSTPTYGTSTLCSLGNLFPYVALAVGLVVSFFILFVISVAIICCVCCCVPGCLLFSASRNPRVTYHTI